MCGCTKNRKNQGKAATLRPSTVKLDAGSGTYTTGSCSEAYSGPLENRTFYVVDLAGDPQLFTVENRDKAIALAHSGDLTIDPLPATKLCRDLVVAAMGE